MNNKTHDSSSRFGIFLGLACAVHCMAMPLIIIAFPFLNESVMHNPVVEWSILGLLAGLGIYSMNHYRRDHHQNNTPIYIFGAGLSLFLAALLLAPPFHHLMTILGSVLIAVSHGVNLALKKAIA